MVTYRGFTITSTPKLTPDRRNDWCYTHPNEDGEGRWSGSCASEKDCKVEIDEILDEEFEP